MTPTEEAHFIQLWAQGWTTDAIAEALSIPQGTARSRAYSLQQQGKIQPRPQGGARPRGQATPHKAPAPPATPIPPAAERKEIQQWTVRLSKALIEHLKAVAYERRQPTSQLLEELLWQALSANRVSTLLTLVRNEADLLQAT